MDGWMDGWMDGMLPAGRPEDYMQMIRANFVPVTVVNWCYWIPALSVNFALVPRHLQVGGGAY